jgi:hypothetical protein
MDFCSELEKLLAQPTPFETGMTSYKDTTVVVDVRKQNQGSFYKACRARLTLKSTISKVLYRRPKAIQVLSCHEGYP